MRTSFFLLASALFATPALAEQAAAPANRIEFPREINGPALTGRLADMMQALSKAFLNLPVGEVQAAVEGRKPTAEERRTTLGDLGRKDDPEFERNLERQIAATKPMLEASVRALARALPAMMKGMEAAGEELERAAANMPRPDYPKR